MSGMTAQEVFDRVVERLFDGTGQAFDRETDSCVYLDDNGLKCAVGIFIPDGHKAQAFRGGVPSLRSTFEDLAAGPIGQHEDLLWSLQADAHDSVYNWEGTSFTGIFSLQEIAREHGLELNIPATSQDSVGTLADANSDNTSEVQS